MVNIKFSFRPNLPLQVTHWSFNVIILLISFVFQMEFTYLNWLTIIFLLIFLIFSLIEITRYRLIINLDQDIIEKRIFFNLYKKNVSLNSIKKIVIFPKYVVIKFAHKQWLLYFRKEELKRFTKLIQEGSINVTINNRDQVFKQFFK